MSLPDPGGHKAIGGSFFSECLADVSPAGAAVAAYVEFGVHRTTRPASYRS